MTEKKILDLKIQLTLIKRKYLYSQKEKEIQEELDSLFAQETKEILKEDFNRHSPKKKKLIRTLKNI